VDAPPSPNTTRMQVEEQEISSTDVLAIVEALQAPEPHVHVTTFHASFVLTSFSRGPA
jgi:hypothetical protein